MAGAPGATRTWGLPLGRRPPGPQPRRAGGIANGPWVAAGQPGQGERPAGQARTGGPSPCCAGSGSSLG